ncbi:MAG: SPFH domain-containing protein [Fibrobacter sp.]|jgi:membrane protease subunit (stomatin/prohibitin family)|nr:SPFH domain-containing protein [Fibrobacter sp.]
MGLLDKIKGEFIDIVEWAEDDSHTLVWRFPRYQNEIKNGAKLTVREGQTAVFVNEGKVADVFKPGMYTLTTQNLPVLSTLRGWKYGFDSPFKAEVYFVSSRRFVDQKWGTRTPVMIQSKDLGSVRVRAYGSYVLQLADARKLIQELVGANPYFTIDSLSDQIRNMIVSKFADTISSSNIPITEIASHYDELAYSMQSALAPEILKYGFNCAQLLVENISLPEEAAAAIDRKSGMKLVGENDYARYQFATSAEIAAGNPGGGAASGMGFGMGIGMAGMVPSAQQPANPPKVPAAKTAVWWVARGQEKEGPYSFDQITELFHSGKLTESSLVWKPGMANWDAFKNVPETKSMVPPEVPHS